MKGRKREKKERKKQRKKQREKQRKKRRNLDEMQSMIGKDLNVFFPHLVNEFPFLFIFPPLCLRGLIVKD